MHPVDLVGRQQTRLAHPGVFHLSNSLLHHTVVLRHLRDDGREFRHSEAKTTERRPANLPTVVLQNGPGNNGSEVRNGMAYNIKAGDVVVIPAGSGHWFTRIDDHIDYLMVRIDPDKVTPTKSEAQSREYLSKPARRGE